MWAQIVTVRLKSGDAEPVERMLEHLREAEPPGSGLIRHIVTRDQSDPQVIKVLAIFESEEKARTRESDPRRAEATAAVGALMAEITDGPASFDNLDVIEEIVY